MCICICIWLCICIWVWIWTCVRMCVCICIWIWTGISIWIWILFPDSWDPPDYVPPLLPPSLPTFLHLSLPHSLPYPYRIRIFISISISIPIPTSISITIRRPCGVLDPEPKAFVLTCSVRSKHLRCFEKDHTPPNLVPTHPALGTPCRPRRVPRRLRVLTGSNFRVFLYN